MTTNVVHFGASLPILNAISDESVDMIYIDPPFGTQTTQTMNRRSHGENVSKISYDDRFEDYLGFLRPHLKELHRILKKSAVICLHLDRRWCHYIKIELDTIFGRDNFLNEIIWSYNSGTRGKKDRFPQKHDTIFVYAKSMDDHIFNWNDVDRIPYATPATQYMNRTKEEADKRIAEGQVPTDVWQMTFGNMSKERTGYPSQKPQKLIERLIKAFTPRGGLIVDAFAGSGTTGSAAMSLGRNFILIDESKDAIDVMKKRFTGIDVSFV
jgi:site-specific DNA-methyltransferase (adenine-specific)